MKCEDGKCDRDADFVFEDQNERKWYSCVGHVKDVVPITLRGIRSLH